MGRLIDGSAAGPGVGLLAPEYPHPTTQLPRHTQAMATLSSMFSHIPTATLTAALRAHKWHMENTVAYLLDESSRGYATVPSADADAPQHPPPAASTPAPLPRRYQGRGKPTTLPDDFLRVPGRPRSSSSTAASEDQLRADEALARQLQQQEEGLSRVDTRYQQHRRARAASLQHAPSQHPHQRRPRVQSAPRYPSSADAGGRAPSPAEEGLEKLGKALGQVGVRCCVCMWAVPLFKVLGNSSPPKKNTPFPPRRPA